MALPDHYALLRLPPPPHTPTPAAVKRAYHAALLLHHPDKSSSAPGAPTVDELSTAYKVLSTPAARREYDALLSAQTQRGERELRERVVQAVDLDEFAEEEDADGAKWTRACRCGEAQGYTVREKQLEEAAEEGEVVVGCVGCSLWCKITFDVVDNTEDQ